MRGKPVTGGLGTGQRSIDLVIVHNYLVIQKEGVFKSVQCKTARPIKNGAVLRFKACSQNVLTAERRSYKGEVDFFGVYSPDLDKSYLVPNSRNFRHGSLPSGEIDAEKYAKDSKMGSRF